MLLYCNIITPRNVKIKISIMQGKTLYQNVYGDKAGNNAGEHIAVDNTNGDLMIFVDSDTKGGFGFMKLSPN